MSTLPPDAAFQSFLGLTAFCKQLTRKIDLPRVHLKWVAWADPGTHTGFAMVLYAIQTAAPGASRDGDQYAVNRRFWDAFRRSAVWPSSLMLGGSLEPEEGDDAGNLGHGKVELCAASLLGIHTELLEGDERSQTRKMVGRIRRMGKQFCGESSWDPTTDDVGEPRIGAESFHILRQDASVDYASPLRVRSMLAYGIETEFGLDLQGQNPGDAKTAFDDDRMRRFGLYIPGPDHVRDALAHALLDIRKRG